MRFRPGQRDARCVTNRLLTTRVKAFRATTRRCARKARSRPAAEVRAAPVDIQDLVCRSTRVHKCDARDPLFPPALPGAIREPPAERGKPKKSRGILTIFLRAHARGSRFQRTLAACRRLFGLFVGARFRYNRRLVVFGRRFPLSRLHSSVEGAAPGIRPAERATDLGFGPGNRKRVALHANVPTRSSFGRRRGSPPPQWVHAHR